ncbi:MAG: protein adenylyltransferase SelO [Burkholderiaceae bacterium]
MSSSIVQPLDHSFLRELGEGFCIPWKAAEAPRPELVFFNPGLAAEVGLAGLLAPAGGSLDAQSLARWCCGNALSPDIRPVAQAYAGHQFGNFSPRLGDGRALLLGEIVSAQGERYDIALKGSGRTPFSRGGDGKAAIGPMLREVLVSESLHALGVPTTRALAVVSTGEPIFREEVLPGALLARVAQSHLRVGSFQYFAARGEYEQVQRLADYAIRRHDSALLEWAPAQRYAEFLKAVVARQARLLAQWMNLGFIHGVMNTDNMTISGQTIDYGPCAFLEDYDPDRWFSSIDLYGRYAYKNQPAIAVWNLSRFAECLLPLLSENTDEAVSVATGILEGFQPLYQQALFAGQCAKLGLRGDEGTVVQVLIDDWLGLLQSQKVDYTLAWRLLADHAADRSDQAGERSDQAGGRSGHAVEPEGARAVGGESRLQRLFSDIDALRAWLARWQAVCASEDQRERSGRTASRAQAMRAVNPRIIARNHWVEDALKAASEEARMVPFERLLEALREPFSDEPGFDRFAQPAAKEVTASYRTFCGT